MRRRDFLLGSLAGAGVLGAGAMIAAGGGDSNGTGSHSSGAPGTSAPGSQLTTQQGPSRRTYGGETYEQGAAVDGAPNVIFISLDDQNDWLGFLENHPGTKTPNLDALATESVNFTGTYAAAPMCLPSRTALLFGQPAATTHVYDHSPDSRAAWEEFTGDTPSLMDDFWVAGYDVRGVGKIFNFEGPERWSTYARSDHWLPGPDRASPDARATGFDPNWISPYDDQPIGNGARFVPGDIDFGPTGVPLEAEPTMQAANWARQQLAQEYDRPFFLGVGLGSMHDPWRVPQQFLDEHPLDEVVTPEYRPEDLNDLPPYARENIVDTFGAFGRLYNSGKWPDAIQACQAATTFADYCVGLLLDDLAASPYADNTIVVVFSDNGFHLGEKMHLHKFTLWEPATHVPLLIKAPGLDAGVVDAPVSLMDLGPTLHELADVKGLYADHQGESLLQVVDDPDVAAERPPIMTWREGNHAVRREQWRYIRYEDGSTELYDISEDPDEYDNLSGRPLYGEIEAELDPLLPTSG